MKLRSKKIMTFLIAFAMVTTIIPGNYSKTYAKDKPQGDSEKVLSDFVRQNTYDQYIEQHKGASKPQKGTTPSIYSPNSISFDFDAKGK